MKNDIAEKFFLTAKLADFFKDKVSEIRIDNNFYSVMKRLKY